MNDLREAASGARSEPQASGDRRPDSLRPALGQYRPVPGAAEMVAKMRAALSKGGVRAVVVGAGKSGLSAAELLLDRGAKVTLADDRNAAALGADATLASLLDRVEASPITADALAGAELVVLSPGVPRSRPELAAAIQRGVVIGEIELASWFVKAPLVGITGTNGKSTTTALLGHLFQAAGLRVFAGGNLGDPLANLARSGREVDVAVVELSSYQLESLVTARFEVAAWLNLTPDHADRYLDLAHYAAAKARLLEQRTVTGIAVLNATDPWCLEAGQLAGGACRYFDAPAEPSEGATLAREAGTSLSSMNEAVRRAGSAVETYALANPALPGLHNRANMVAAIECARHLGASKDGIQRGLLSFAGLPHRIELVGTIDGVRYYNDSKATNVDSAVIALRALEGRKILIAGGKDKGAPWAPLVEAAVTGEVAAVLAIGKAAPIVLEAFGGKVPIVEEPKTLDAALLRAKALARPGDSVLLSPACASFDQFKNYEHRGDTFRELVAAMAGVRCG